MRWLPHERLDRASDYRKPKFTTTTLATDAGSASVAFLFHHQTTWQIALREFENSPSRERTEDSHQAAVVGLGSAGQATLLARQMPHQAVGQVLRSAEHGPDECQPARQPAEPELQIAVV